jgi:hypothetical protein
MARWWVLGGLVLGWVVFRHALRPALAMLFGREIGARALAQVPDTVTLSRRADDAWQDHDQARRLWEPLLSHGFADAGTYGVEQMPGVVMRLLASPSESIMAIVYEHPRVGQWLELSSYYTDGRRCSASNHASNGVDAPDFVTELRAVDAPALELLELVRCRRPEGALLPMSAADAARRFEHGYAEAMAWRRQHPVTTREVVSVAMKGRAA